MRILLLILQIMLQVCIVILQPRHQIKPDLNSLQSWGNVSTTIFLKIDSIGIKLCTNLSPNFSTSSFARFLDVPMKQWPWPLQYVKRWTLSYCLDKFIAAMVESTPPENIKLISFLSMRGPAVILSRDILTAVCQSSEYIEVFFDGV